MKCISPYTKQGQAFGCGQCLPCRLSKRRIWKTRILLEAAQYTENSFVTLTYEDKNLPGTHDGLPNLVPRELRLFLGRLREKLPTKIRFFAVGEYGPKTFRPHFHIGIFNFQNCGRGQTRQNLRGRCMWSGCCPQCELVGNTWGKGDIEIRSLGTEKCEYLARYVTKKMTSKEDARLLGRHPEFSRQSRRPGVGFPGVAALAKAISDHVDSKSLVDVPSIINQGKNNPLPLGRYIRNKLRIALDLPEGAPDEVLRQAWYEQVLPVLQMAKADNAAPSLREKFAEVNAPYEAKLRAQMEIKEGAKL